jgi:flagellar biosynthesis protein FlhF
MTVTNGQQTRVFEGRTLDEILPRIREELGADAVITRQREGLKGGIAGFFQRRFVEVEARPGSSVDVYDDGGDATPDAAADPATAEGLRSPAIQQIRRQATPFAEYLSASQRQIPEAGEDYAVDANGRSVEPADEPAQQPTAESPAVEWTPEEPSGEVPLRRRRPSEAAEIENTLVEVGLSPKLAAAIVDRTVAHLLPFTQRRELKRLVRAELARRIPVQSTWRGVGRRVAFVGSGGSGKTLCTARLAAVYAAAGDLPVTCLTLRPRGGDTELTWLLAGTGVNVKTVSSASEIAECVAEQPEESLVVLDTPSVSPRSTEDVEALGAELREAGISEVHLTVPAMASSPAARGMVERFAALGVNRLVLTHADETEHIGGTLDLAIRHSRPLSYVSHGTELPGGLDPADPLTLATQVLP